MQLRIPLSSLVWGLDDDPFFPLKNAHWPAKWSNVVTKLTSFMIQNEKKRGKNKKRRKKEEKLKNILFVFRCFFSIVKLSVCHLKKFDVLIYVNVSFGTLPVEVRTPFLFFLHWWSCCCIILDTKKEVFFLKMSLEDRGEILHMKALSSSPSQRLPHGNPDYILLSSPIYLLTIYPTSIQINIV